MSSRLLAAAAGVLALLGFGWAMYSAQQPAPSSSADADRVASPARAATHPAAAPSTTTSAAPAARPAPQPAPTPGDAKLALLEDSPPSQDSADTEAVDFDTPRPGPDAELWPHESDREADLDPAIKAEQAWSMRAALDTRTQALRAQLAEAQAQDRHDESKRLEQMITRLEQRGAALERDATDFDAQAAQAHAAEQPDAPEDTHTHEHPN